MSARPRKPRSYLLQWRPLDPRLTEAERLARVHAPGGCHHDYWSELVVVDEPARSPGDPKKK